MTEPSVLIRAAQASDRDAIWPLAREFATSFTPRREAFDSSYDTVLGDPHALLLVAQPGPGEVLGYLLAFSHATFLANAPVAWVEELMVAPAHRGEGLGRALMVAAEEWASSLGTAYVALASRRAGPFYQALGYQDSAVFYRKLST